MSVGGTLDVVGSTLTGASHGVWHTGVASSTTEWTIGENHSIIARLRQENQGMQSQLLQLKPERKGLKVEQSVQHVRSLIDKAAQRKRLGAAQLNKVVNDLYSIPRDTTLSSESVAALQKIRGLENRLDKAYLKHNEAASIRSTYQQLVVTLGQDRLQLQQQLGIMQEAAKQLGAELDQAVVANRETTHRREKAKLSLQQAEQALSAHRLIRSKQLQHKRHAGADVDDRTAPSTTGSSACSKDSDLNSLCHALQVSTPADLPFKVTAQKQTLEELGRALEAAEVAVSSLAGQKAGLQQQVAELQAGGHQRTQAAIDRLKAQQKEAAAELEQSKEALEQVTQGLVEVQAGVQHLSGMLAVLQVANAPPAAPSDASLLDSLARMQTSLRAAQSLIQQYPAAQARMQALMDSVDY